MSWTEERVELLKKLWAEGLTASKIALQLGGVSRNAVIGKIHRLKLSNRVGPKISAEEVENATAKKKEKKSSAPQMQAAVKLVAENLPQKDALPLAEEQKTPSRKKEEPVLQSRQLNLLELTERTCKWPLGDPLAEDFHFCGADVRENGPYCAYHKKIAFQPVSERRRRAS
mgnify:CR=1 FL=1